MSFAAALVLIAQSAASTAAITPAAGEGSSRGHVAEQVSVSVTILRPARISAVLESDEKERANAPAQRIQRSRDDAGTLWIEFS